MDSFKKCKHRNCNRLFNLDFLEKNTKDPIFSNPKEYAKTKFKERIYCSKNCQIQELALQKTDKSIQEWKKDKPLCPICKKEKQLKYCKTKNRIRWSDSYKAKTCGDKVCEYLRFLTKDDDFGYKDNELKNLQKKLSDEKEFKKFKNIRIKISSIRCRTAREFNLTVKYLYSIFPISMCCPVYNTPMVFELNYGEAFMPSVDRIDSKKGYVKGNVVWMSNKANKFKNKMDIDDVKKLYNYMSAMNIESEYPEMLGMTAIGKPFKYCERINYV